MPAVVKKLEVLEREATLSEISRVASYLQEHLGQRVTAYLSGIKDAKMVGQWASGRRRPRDPAGFRLRQAYPAARLLVDTYGNETAKAWFFGTNLRLDDEAPAYILRYGKTPDDFRFVVPAAELSSKEVRAEARCPPLAGRPCEGSAGLSATGRM